MKNFIDVVVDDGNKWRLTGMYGELTWNQKGLTWDATCSLHDTTVSVKRARG